MVNLQDFNIYVGSTIMECQRIEHDVKLIYAGMLQGDFNQNFGMVKNMPLGPVLTELEKLDNSDGTPYLTKSDYRLLKEIKNVRNWLVHACYSDFIYSKGDSLDRNFTKGYNKLLDFNKKMKVLGNQVEKVRLQILKHFGRI